MIPGIRNAGEKVSSSSGTTRNTTFSISTLPTRTRGATVTSAVTNDPVEVPTRTSAVRTASPSLAASERIIVERLAPVSNT